MEKLQSLILLGILYLFIFSFILLLFFRYFLHLYFKYYPKSLLYPLPPPTLLLYPVIPTCWPWFSPVLGHIKFARQRGLSFWWWPTRPSSTTYAARDTSSGVVISSYCCSTYRVEYFIHADRSLPSIWLKQMQRFTKIAQHRQIKNTMTFTRK